jgi:ADP-dependent NAD(P)H-hydrate dehydratase / NAD(P)H-hydrate epimerase
VIPVVTPDEMAAIDRAAPEPVEVLIGRAGAAVARAAVELLGGTYGRRVVVLAGKGNNGNDGREAARRLRARGVRVDEVDALSSPGRLPAADLVVDAAFGTGFRGSYRAPDAGSAPVLAVDIPSGVDGLTGRVSERVLPARRTVTFAALKPGLLVPPGAELAGDIDVADIGLAVPTPATHLVEGSDIAAWIPAREPTAHKWQSAVNVVGGSAGLEGAATLTALGALRAGAGYVRWSSPGGVPVSVKPLEVVGVELPVEAWSSVVLDDHQRFEALVVGNGLGLDAGHARQVASVVRDSTVPVVVDADAITLLGGDAAGCAQPSTIFTPHDGEFARLAGEVPGADRLASARTLSARLGAVVLLKGPLTIVAEPGGQVLLANSGDDRLATLGTGDVLAGVVAALVSCGLDPFRAAAAGAFIHGRAATLGWRRGMVAGDLLDHLPRVLEMLVHD